MKDIKIKDLEIGDIAKVVKYENFGNRQYRSKILSMGLTRGAIIKVLKKAPFGDPIEIEIRGFHLTLRKNEANMIIVRRINGN